MSSIFGNIVFKSDVELAVLNTLQTWFPTYLREAERLLGLQENELSNPRNYTTRNSFDAIPGEEIPKVVVVSDGTIETPAKDGESKYRATWQVGVGVAMAAPTEEEAQVYVGAYAGAVRALILQNASLGGLAASTSWIGENYPDLPITNQLQLYKAANVYFKVEVENTVTKRAGPTQPTDSGGQLKQFQTVDATLIKEPING